MNEWTSAAADHINASIASVEFELAALITKGDCQAAYDKAFIAKCSLLEPDALFDVKRRLKVLKDFSVREWERRVKAEQETVTRPAHVAVGWKTLLDRSEQGVARPNLRNAMIALRNAPEWTGVLAYDELSCRIVKLRPTPYSPTIGQWTDTDDIKTAEWLQENSLNIGVAATQSACQGIASETRVHPVRDYLNSLQWDGESRIQSWLTDYFGVERTNYSLAVGPKWLISAVARVMNPGCQVDSCLILEGPQGIRKSSGLRILTGDEWFTDQLSDLGHKDSSQDLAGKWIVELSDLAPMSRVETNVLKSFISRRVDHYRQSFGHRSQDFPRQCVFSATTNQTGYLTDETGGRRWWPVKCGAMNTAAISRDRDQLWAEAYACFRDSQAWWIEDQAVAELTREEQHDRMVQDAMLEGIRAYLGTYHSVPADCSEGSVSIHEVLASLTPPVNVFDQTIMTRAARVLVSEGWVRFKERKGSRPWRYRSPDVE